MNFTGLTYRYITALQSASFKLENFQTDAVQLFGSNPTGFTGKELRFGFSGIHLNTGWFFSFRNGKMYDPEGRWFYSYDENIPFDFSGNISTGNYDYYVNDELIGSVGIKSGFDMNAWFVNCISGASGQGNVYINSPTIPTSVNFPTSFVSGSTWSGTFSHSNTGPLVIRSGELRMTDAVQFQISGTGLSFNGGFNVVNTGASLLIGLNHTGLVSRTGLFVVGLRIYTDFGPVDFTISGTGTPPSNSIVSNNLYSDTTGDVISTGNGTSGTKYWYYTTVATTLSGTPLTKSTYFELTYLSGATGNFRLVTGFQITNSGTGYVGPVSVLVIPTGGSYPLASGTGFINTSSSSGISSIVWLTSGYYTGTTGSYTLSFSSPSGRFASGIPLFSGAYVKSFTGQFQLITGLFSSGNSGAACNSGPTNIFSGNTTLATGENLVTLRINYLGTRDSANIQYKILASGLRDSITLTSILSGSGLAYRI
jgi:hypothetical protein